MKFELEAWGVAVTTTSGNKIYHVAVPTDEGARARVLAVNEGEDPTITHVERTANTRCLRGGEHYQVDPGPLDVMGNRLRLSPEQKLSIEKDLDEERQRLASYASGDLRIGQAQIGGPIINMTEDQIEHSRRIVTMLEALLSEDAS